MDSAPISQDADQEEHQEQHGGQGVVVEVAQALGQPGREEDHRQPVAQRAEGDEQQGAEEEVEPADALLDEEEIVGQQTRYPTGAGKPLRKSLLVTPEVIRAGQRVSVLIQERTFTVSTEGKAIHRAGAGDRVRVLLDNRRTVNGVAQPDGSVVVEL